jgi:FAD dependent oxidoreductase/NAD(P)-binding Rossmann-like domain
MISCALVLALAATQQPAVLVEAEAFDTLGGWTLDTQFTFEMGSPYLLAHGLGRPVDKASTRVQLPSAGAWRVWVRTKDWVARWGVEGAPGRFHASVDGLLLPTEFGVKGANWAWQDGGVIRSSDTEVFLELHDLTGFDGRCDAILFTQVDASPPPDDAPRVWRDTLLGNPPLTVHEGYDLVVVGGGYSGMGAAISAARMGCKVALIQDRPVLGGNGSSEIRVWSKGHIRRGKYPRIGEIVEEFADNASKSPGAELEFGDAHKEAVVRAEPNIDLFLMHRMDGVRLGQGKGASDAQIEAVEVLDIRRARRVEFRGKLFLDATGHGWLAAAAGAEGEMTPDGRMGMSNMWRWENAEQASRFSATPWALDLEMEDFPYPRRFHAEWFWESGFDQDPIGDAEGIRDWNLRAAYGAFEAMKNRGGTAEHLHARMTWLAAIGGPRESRRFFGDVILTQDDVVEKRDFKDGCVPSTWTIDLHYPKKQYEAKFPDNPFISIAVHDDRVDRDYGYPVPYRCFYSRNVPNLFLAGRCVSVTHEALGTVRVMRTCGMMGEVVGKAASIAAREGVGPRAVYELHWDEMHELLQLPGVARRSEGMHGEVVLPDIVQLAAGAYGPMSGIDPQGLEGVIVDERAAQLIGAWSHGDGLQGHIGWGYHYASADTGAEAVFELTAPSAGAYQVRLAYREHENRGTTVPIAVRIKDSTYSAEYRATLNMQRAPSQDGFEPLRTLSLQAGDVVRVSVGTDRAGGLACVDACQLIAVSTH